MRLLITASRDWTDESTISLEMAWYAMGSKDVTVVHGDCPTGGDAIADKLAPRMSFAVERHPADWRRWGRAAGFRRNAEMVALGADVCLAFIKNNSKGATMTADLAEKAGIPTFRFREDEPS